jgi:hypothetical protein
MKLKKAQSAMEYLMTYGWAILIIAVVLGALFSLGVFNGTGTNGTGTLGTACIARSDYLCQNPVYTHVGANIIVTVGQSTGTNWASANFMFVPQGQPTTSGPSSLPLGLTPTAFSDGLGNTLYSTGFTAGQSASITLPVNGVSGTTINVGAAATGTIWVQYVTSVAPGLQQYAQIATINVKSS